MVQTKSLPPQPFWGNSGSTPICAPCRSANECVTNQLTDRQSVWRANPLNDVRWRGALKNVFYPKHATLQSLYTLPCRSVGPSAGPSRNIFELRVVFASLLLPNCPRLNCRVSGLVCLLRSFDIGISMAVGSPCKWYCKFYIAVIGMILEFYSFIRYFQFPTTFPLLSVSH